MQNFWYSQTQEKSWEFLVYENILEELGLKKDFNWKSYKKIIILRHFEADKKNKNWKLTEKWLENAQNFSQKLKKYLKNENDLVFRWWILSQKLEWVVERIKQSFDEILKEKSFHTQINSSWLDSRQKVNFDQEADNLEKNDLLLKEELNTSKWLLELKEKWKKNWVSNNTELWLVHSTNMNVIWKFLNNEYQTDKSYHKMLEMWESIEVDIDKNWEAIFNRNDLLNLNINNFSYIIDSLRNIENLWENIKKAIKYFDEWKIKIIDLQNVINKEILENKNFLNILKNSTNTILQNIAFINILKKENLGWEEKIEKIIFENNLENEIIELIKYFDKKLNKTWKFSDEIDLVFKENKQKFLDLIKIIWKINSKKILDLKTIEKVNEVYEKLKEKNKKEDFWEIDKIIWNSILSKTYSNIFSDLEKTKKILWVEENNKQIFVIKANIYKGPLDFDVNITNIKIEEIFNENNRKKDLFNTSKKNIKNPILENNIKNFLQKNTDLDEKAFNIWAYIILEFKDNKLVLENFRLNYDNLDQENDFINLEEYLQNWIFDWKLNDNFKIFLKSKMWQKNIEDLFLERWFIRHLINIIWKEVDNYYFEIIKKILYFTWKNHIFNDVDWKNSYSFDNFFEKDNIKELKKNIPKNEIQVIKNKFLRKFEFFNELINFLFEKYDDEEIKILFIKRIKEILEFLRN